MSNCTYTKPSPARTKADPLAHVAAAAGVPKKQVSAVLEGLAAHIKQSLSTTGMITILGLVKIERKTIPDCPTWPPYVKVTVMPELLPGPDDYCIQGLHTYHESPATNDRRQPICGACGKDDIDWDRLHVRDIADVDYAVAQLKTDRFRHKWWSKDLDPAAIKHALRKGRAGIDEAIRKGCVTRWVESIAGRTAPCSPTATALRHRFRATSSTTGSTRPPRAAGSASKRGTASLGGAS
jgi:hypothetical protein